jgi:hypothetical protein
LVLLLLEFFQQKEVNLLLHVVLVLLLLLQLIMVPLDNKLSVLANSTYRDPNCNIRRRRHAGQELH